jgi:hypothetical protein
MALFWKEFDQLHPDLVEFNHGSTAAFNWKGPHTLEVHFWGEAAPSKAAAEARLYSAFRFAWDLVFSDDGSYRITNDRNLPIE